MKEWILSLSGISWQVRQQLLEIVVMLLGGMTIGLFRTAEQMFVVRLRLCGITAWLEEVLFWIVAGFTAAEFFYYSAYGEWSAHGLVALAAGFFLWKKAFSFQIVAFLSAISNGIMKRSAIAEERMQERAYGKTKQPHGKERRRR